MKRQRQHATWGSTASPVTPVQQQPISKWEILRELATARRHFDLSDRDMTVLQALLSFWPKTELDPTAEMVIHPSNRSICERLNGMANSTMRRYLGRLVAAGLLLRRDSPNGKRYARRYAGDKVAYGFDLSPLLHRHGEICAAAEEIRAAEHQLKRQRETVSLMRRDLAGLAAYGGEIRPDLALWDRLGDLAALTARALRRKLSLDELNQLGHQLRAALDEARDILDPVQERNTPDCDGVDTPDLSSKDAEIEQHHQNSQKDSDESERAGTPDKHEERSRQDRPTADQQVKTAHGRVGVSSPEDANLPNMPLSLVLSACPEIQSYAGGGIRHWHDLVRTAHVVSPMMGISVSAWEDAKRAMGPEEAAVVVASMLERFGEIKNPGGYLRHLTGKAVDGRFSCGPMVMALVRKDAA